MKKNYKSILLTGSFIIGVLLTGQVVAQQKSSYTPLVHTGYFDYKVNYNPESSKVLNSDGETVITTSHADFSFEKIKIFVPPGTKRFYAKFQTYLSSTEPKAAVRFGEVPVAIADNVNQNTRFIELDKTLDRLLLGEELVFHSPGGSGALSISQPNSTDNSNAVKGGYIYINLLSIPGGVMYGFKTRMVVDEACYRRWYASANTKWDSQNNPDENANHTCDGSGGSGGGVDPTTPRLTGIQLSTLAWKAGTATANAPITVTPVGDAGVKLVSCTPEATTNGSSLDVSSALKITLKPDGQKAELTIEKPELINQAEDIKITCDGKSATLTLWPADTPNPVMATLASPVTETTVDNISTLTVKLQHTAAELAAGGKIEYFVAAHIPQFAHPFEQANDQWAFLSLPDTGTGPANWKILFQATPLEKLAFEKDVAIPQDKQVTLPINLQLPIDALKGYNAKLYLGYRQGGAAGTFKALTSPIWQPPAN